VKAFHAILSSKVWRARNPVGSGKDAQSKKMWSGCFKTCAPETWSRAAHAAQLKELSFVVLKTGAPGKKCARFKEMCFACNKKARQDSGLRAAHARSYKKKKKGFYCFKKARQRTWWKARPCAQLKNVFWLF
jgi:hypothetical protein